MTKGGSQTERLYNVLKDKEPHRTDELLAKVYGSSHLGIARISARIYDIKRNYRLMVKNWHDKKQPSLTWYQII